jgi:hypothetical protein
MSELIAEYWWAILGAFGVVMAWVFLRRRQAHG